MIRYDRETLRRIQLIQLDMLKEVDRICRKLGIRYNIIAGTLLGAVRNGGFIPWDDDADVAMLRDEYDRFVTACRVELNTDKYYFQDHTVTPGYRWGYGKLRRKDSVFLRENQEMMPYEQGIFMDIFPLDSVPDKYIPRALKNAECFCVRKTLYSPVGAVASKSPVSRAVYRMLSNIPEERVLAYYDGMIKRAKRKKTDHVRILMFPTPNRSYSYLRAWYEESEDIMFEGARFSAIKDHDGYLTFKYGEYMKLPPVEERKIHPVTVLRIPEDEI